MSKAHAKPTSGGLTPSKLKATLPEFLRLEKNEGQTMGFTLLMVDDDEDLLKVASISIQMTCDWEILTAPGGVEAIASAKQHIPDLILLDYMMPETNGLMVLEELREDHTTRDIPILFFTAACDDKTSKMLLKAGAIGVISKPFEPIFLAKEIRGYLKQHQYGEPDEAG